MSIRPDYYTRNGLEAFDVIKAFFMDKAFLSHAFKYMARAGRKGDEREDIRKAITYLEAHLETLEPDIEALTERTFGDAPFIDRANEVCNLVELGKAWKAELRIPALDDENAHEEEVAYVTGGK